MGGERTWTIYPFHGDLTMKRLPHVAMLLVAVAVVAADKCEKKKKSDAEKIQGK